MKALVIAEHNNRDLKPSTLNTISAALKLNGDVHVLVAGQDVGSVIKSVSKIDSISRVLFCDDEIYKNFLAENFSDLILGIAKNYTHIMMPSSTFGKNIMPRVAASLDVPQISDIISVEDHETFKRPIYAGNAIATVKCMAPIKVITVRGTAFSLAEVSNGNVETEELPAGTDSGKTIFAKQDLSKSDRPELTSAKIIISGGRGMQNGENFKMLEKIADKLGAAIGASRAAVDAGFVPNDWQVGQTGKIVAPDLYIAVGISGAIQHLAGIKDSKIIVAINKDEEAPIFQIADYGLVADLFQVLPELSEKL